MTEWKIAQLDELERFPTGWFTPDDPDFETIRNDPRYTEVIG